MFESLNPFDEGNLMVAGFIEDEINVNNAKSAFDYLQNKYGMYLTANDIDIAFEIYNVDYISLPQYAKNWFNYFELPED